MVNIKILLVLVVLLAASSCSVYGTSLSKDNTEEETIAIVGVVSGLGSGIMTVANAVLIKSERPSVGAGVTGIVFGATAITMMTLAEAHESMDVKPPAWAMLGTLSAFSITAGIWAIVASRADRNSKLSNNWMIESPISLDRRDSAYRLMFVMKF
jgi:drug/metabolite transporter (DMT)-like permease